MFRRGFAVGQAEHRQIVELLRILDEVVHRALHVLQHLIRICLGAGIERGKHPVGAEHLLLGVGRLRHAVRVDEQLVAGFQLQLEPGTKSFVYTDGVPEAANAQIEMFGTERMLTVLNQDAALSPEATLRNVRRAVDDFVQDAEQFDDLTMLCLEYKGPEA